MFNERFWPLGLVDKHQGVPEQVSNTARVAVLLARETMEAKVLRGRIKLPTVDCREQFSSRFL